MQEAAIRASWKSFLTLRWSDAAPRCPAGGAKQPGSPPLEPHVRGGYNAFKFYESAVVRPSASSIESFMLLCNTTLYAFLSWPLFFTNPSVLHFAAAFGCERSQQSLPGSSDLVKKHKETHYVCAEPAATFDFKGEESKLIL